MIKPSRILLRVLLAVLIGTVALALTTASAADLVRIGAHPEMSYVDPDDDDLPVEKVGIDLLFDAGGLTILSTNAGEGALGNAEVPCYDVEDLPEDAIERVMPDTAARWLCVARPYPGGGTFRLTSVNVVDLVATAMNRIAALGCQVGPSVPGAHEFSFTCGGNEFRAVCNADADGTLVDIGR